MLEMSELASHYKVVWLILYIEAMDLEQNVALYTHCHLIVQTPFIFDNFLSCEDLLILVVDGLNF